MKQFAPASERNREPILAVLSEVLPRPGRVLEIASGTGQHAVFFAAAMKDVQWQPTDLASMMPSIRAWAAEVDAPNLAPPEVLDLSQDASPSAPFDAVVCINTVHIVPWPEVERLFALAGRVLATGGLLYLYGPFRYRDRPFEPSNARFDAWLRECDPASGVRDFETLDALAGAAGLELAGDRAMPSNNRSIWWCRRSTRRAPRFTPPGQSSRATRKPR